MAKKAAPQPAAPAAPSSNWRALKSALNPAVASTTAGVKRKRGEGGSVKGKEKAEARTKEEEAEELARAKGAESKGKRRELPIMELLEGKTEKWQEE